MSIVHEEIRIDMDKEVTLKPRKVEENYNRIGKDEKPFIYDTNTSNTSFIQVSMDLRRLGIKNHMFMLKLYDSDLVGVDPFDPNLSQEMMAKVIIESVANPYYFVRECVRIPIQGSGGVPFILHRANLASLFLFFNNVDHYLVIPRQKGKTVAAVTATLWAYLLGTSNSQIMYVNKRLENANENLQRMKDFRDALPEYMRSTEAMVDGKVVKGRENVKSITHPILNNSVVTKPSASSVEAATGIGRGNTQPIQYYDEVEFTPFILTIIKASGPAFKTASANARMNNAPYGRIFTSTPGDLDTRSGKESQELLKGMGRWTEKLYDMSKKEIKEFVDINAENKIIYIEYNYKQLGEGEEWLNEMSSLLLYDRTDIKREIHLQRVHGSSNNPFDPQDIEALMDLKQKPIRQVTIFNKFVLDFYSTIDKSKIYIAGVDCSRGVGIDNNAVTFVDPDTRKPVAEFKSPYIGPVDFKNFLYETVSSYLPRTILCIERNVGGYALVDELMHTDIKNNIYYDVMSNVMSSHDKKYKNGTVEYEAIQRRYQGIDTTAKSRELMMSILQTQMINNKDLFVTQNIITDIGGLIIKNGRIDHGPTSHDDSLMSYLIALYVLDYGKNLYNYGFIPGVNNAKDHQKEKVLDDIMEQLPDELRSQFIEYIDPQREIEKEYDELEIARRKADAELRSIGAIKEGSTKPIAIESLQAEVPWDFFDDLNDIDSGDGDLW